MEKRPKPRIEGHISKNDGAVSLEFINETGDAITAQATPEHLRQMVLILLKTGSLAAQRTGRYPSGSRTHKDVGTDPLPVFRVGLISGPNKQSHILGLAVGEIEIGFRLEHDMARDLGQALMAASSSGTPH